MSEEQTQSSDDAGVQSQAESTQQEKDEFVRRQAYEEVSKDMHKFKDRAKEAAAKASEYEAKLKAIEEDRLKQQEEWQTLYEKERQQKEEMEQKYGTEKENYLRSVKLAGLKAELGSNIKDAYLKHADLDKIEFTEDGALSPESVSAVANKFREEHSILIPAESGNQITNQAPINGSVAQKEKSLNEMSFQERSALLKNLKK
jgi:hypothetical protein